MGAHAFMFSSLRPNFNTQSVSNAFTISSQQEWPSNYEPPSVDMITKVTNHTFVDATQSHIDAQKRIGLVFSFHE